MQKSFVVTENPTGCGREPGNVRIYSTRAKFIAHSRVFGPSQPEDIYLQQIEAILGVCEASVYEHHGLYDVFVKKATAYTWDELAPQIEKILTNRHNEYFPGDSSNAN